jgi:uncharacterized protein (TIGR02646 family)
MRFVNKQRLIPNIFSEIVDPVLLAPVNNGYNNLGNLKPRLLEILIDEQNGLCAYCNQKITYRSATVEHLICQSHNPNYDLNYHNIFAVCQGNEGRVETSHCDKFRANGKRNDYFIPFILLKKCVTLSWDSVNPFFDVEFNRRSGIVSGKIIAKEANIDGYPTMNPCVEYAINSLNLNAQVLVDARKEKWNQVLEIQEAHNYNWIDLFNYYLDTNPYTDFCEFVLLAIRKQV